MSVKYKKLVAKRGGVKHKITNCLSRAEDDDCPENIMVCKNTIKDQLKCIQNLDDQIGECYLENCNEELTEEYKSEMENQSDYAVQIGLKLAALTCETDFKPKVAVEPENSNCKLKLPNLNCPIFSGEGTSHFEYYTFINQFNNIIGLRNNLADSTKLTYLG